MITALTTAITNNTNINIQLQPFNAQPYPNDGMGGDVSGILHQDNLEALGLPPV